MEKNNLVEKVNEAGFENIEEFVKANLGYLPENKQRLFYSVSGIDKASYQTNGDAREYH